MMKICVSGLQHEKLWQRKEQRFFSLIFLIYVHLSSPVKRTAYIEQCNFTVLGYSPKFTAEKPTGAGVWGCLLKTKCV
ncbi:MAG: hypothetical protein HDR52_02935 [Treponema sp.]|nr:hypothetical protein [Treponema sp.]